MNNPNRVMEERAYVWDESGTMLITHQLTAVLDIKRIIRVMEKIMRSSSKLFEIVEARNRTYVKSSDLGKQFLVCVKSDTDAIVRQFPAHRHSPLFLLFKRYTAPIRFIGERAYLEHVEALNQAVAKMRAYKKGEALGRRLDNLRRSERGNGRSCSMLLQALRDQYSKVLAIRLDLEYFSSYNRANGYESQAISLRDAQQHRDAFIAYLRKGPLSKHLIGYAWKLEYGFEKGYHYHFAVFFDGQKVCKDISIGDWLGNHWRQVVTAGKGMFFNCNKKKEAYTRCGVGMICRTDEEKWQALKDAIRYLTKVDLYLRFRGPGRTRTFGIGRVGRPKG